MIYALTLTQVAQTPAAAPGLDVAGVANWAIFWSVVVIFVVIEALLIYTAVRFRHRSAAGTTAPDTPDARRSWPTDLAWTLLPALMTAVILFFTFQTMVNG
ncbi:MAG: cytochrome c oxidase subunit II transmembrane domain-containing protein [Chloroflexaceae bacterium]